MRRCMGIMGSGAIEKRGAGFSGLDSRSNSDPTSAAGAPSSFSAAALPPARLPPLLPTSAQHFRLRQTCGRGRATETPRPTWVWGKPWEIAPESMLVRQSNSGCGQKDRNRDCKTTSTQTGKQTNKRTVKQTHKQTSRQVRSGQARSDQVQVRYAVRWR